MSKKRQLPVTRLLELYESLTEFEQVVAFDLIKSKQKPTKPRQSRQRRTLTELVKPATVPGDARCSKPDCGRFFDDNIHHKKLSAGYHEFIEQTPHAMTASGD